ncbi:MAG: hypothetical protein FJW40_25065 [Acidobacteria bacterium]|nr:hypothetical protein [Acidobacteriota bacterium]
MTLIDSPPAGKTGISRRQILGATACAAAPFVFSRTARAQSRMRAFALIGDRYHLNYAPMETRAT